MLVSNLATRRYRHTFRDAGDEATYRRWRWLQVKRPAGAAAAALLLFTLVVTFEHDLDVILHAPGFMVPVVVCLRVLPLLGLLLCTALYDSGHGRGATGRPTFLWVWPSLVCVAVFLFTTSLHLVSFACWSGSVPAAPLHGLFAGVPCGATELYPHLHPLPQPWLPVAFGALAPWLLGFLFDVPWEFSLPAALASVAVHGGLVFLQRAWETPPTAALLAAAAANPTAALVRPSSVGWVIKDIVTITVLLVLSALLQAWARWTREGQFRSLFRREIGGRRMLHSAVKGKAFQRAVTTEREQGLSLLLRRTDVLVTELDPQMVISYVSPNAKDLLGLEAEEVTRRDWTRWLHPADIAAARAAMDELVLAGNRLACAPPMAQLVHEALASVAAAAADTDPAAGAAGGPGTQSTPRRGSAGASAFPRALAQLQQSLRKGAMGSLAAFGVLESQQHWQKQRAAAADPGPNSGSESSRRHAAARGIPLSDTQKQLIAAQLLTHTRLIYRRKHMEGTYFWVEADAYAVIRRPKAIPGTRRSTQPGQTTILLVERDLGPESMVPDSLASLLQCGFAYSGLVAPPRLIPMVARIPGGFWAANHGVLMTSVVDPRQATRSQGTGASMPTYAVTTPLLTTAGAAALADVALVGLHSAASATAAATAAAATMGPSSMSPDEAQQAVISKTAAVWATTDQNVVATAPAANPPAEPTRDLPRRHSEVSAGASATDGDSKTTSNTASKDPPHALFTSTGRVSLPPINIRQATTGTTQPIGSGRVGTDELAARPAPHEPRREGQRGQDQSAGLPRAAQAGMCASKCILYAIGSILRFGQQLQSKRNALRNSMRTAFESMQREEENRLAWEKQLQKTPLPLTSADRQTLHAILRVLALAMPGVKDMIKVLSPAVEAVSTAAFFSSAPPEPQKHTNPSLSDWFSLESLMSTTLDELFSGLKSFVEYASLGILALSNSSRLSCQACNNPASDNQADAARDAGSLKDFVSVLQTLTTMARFRLVAMHADVALRSECASNISQITGHADFFIFTGHADFFILFELAFSIIACSHMANKAGMYCALSAAEEGESLNGLYARICSFAPLFATEDNVRMIDCINVEPLGGNNPSQFRSPCLRLALCFNRKDSHSLTALVDTFSDSSSCGAQANGQHMSFATEKDYVRTASMLLNYFVRANGGSIVLGSTTLPIAEITGHEKAQNQDLIVVCIYLPVSCASTMPIMPIMRSPSLRALDADSDGNVADGGILICARLTSPAHNPAFDHTDRDLSAHPLINLPGDYTPVAVPTDAHAAVSSGAYDYTHGAPHILSKNESTPMTDTARESVVDLDAMHRGVSATGPQQRVTVPKLATGAQHNLRLQLPLSVQPESHVAVSIPQISASYSRAMDQTPTFDGLRVLFVDDENVNRRLGAKMLSKLKCKVTLYSDGEDVLLHKDKYGIEGSHEHGFDVLFLDIVMSRLDGIKTCRELRNASIRIPIIAMTGFTGSYDLPRLGRNGFDVLLSKPFDLQSIEVALAEAVVRRSGPNAANPTSPRLVTISERNVEK
jgi:CheY-like chemotaxis protein